MARLPKDASEAAEMIGVTQGQTVIAVGPDHGFGAAFTDAVGESGTVVVSSPPPDEETAASVQVVETIGEDAKADHVLAWISIVPVHEARKLAAHVNDDGSLWLVLPKADRDKQAAVTEGDVKRAMLSAGWREDRVVPLTKESFAIRFRRRR